MLWRANTMMPFREPNAGAELEFCSATSGRSDSRLQRVALPGLSAVELLIVGAVLASLATLGGFAYQSYMMDVRETLSKQQNERITEQVATNFDLVIRGANAGLRSQVTGYPITELSTCGEFMDALKVQLQDLKNPYDGSPAITFSSNYSWEQKRGKINGRECKMKDAGIRVTHYKYDCGGRCGDPACIYPSNDCGGHTGGGWVFGGQIEKFYGTVEHRYVTFPDGTIARLPNGDPWVDWSYATSVCPGYSYTTIPKEPDY